MRLKPRVVCAAALLLSVGACADLDMATEDLTAAGFAELLRDRVSTAASAVDPAEQAAEAAAPGQIERQVLSAPATPRPVLRPSRDPDAPITTLSAVNAFVSGCVRQLSDPAKTVAEFSLLGFKRSPNSPRRFSRGALIAGVVTLQEERRYVCYAGAPVSDFDQFVDDIDFSVRRATTAAVERSSDRGRNAWRIRQDDGSVAVISVDRKRREDGLVFSLAKLAYDADG